MPSSWPALAWTQFWQVTLLTSFVLLLTYWIGRPRPQFSYLLCVVVLAKCLVPPIVSSPFGPFTRMKEAWTSPADEAPARTLAATNATPTVELAVESDTAEAPKNPDVSPAPAWIDWRVILLAAWAIGAAALLAVAAYRWAAIRGVLRQRIDRDVAAFNERLLEHCRRANVRPVELIVVDADTTPFVTGVLRPRIVIPSSLLDSLPPEAVDSIIAHELAHVRRGDVLVGHVQLVVQLVYWFHPLVWWLQIRARQLREWCCDEAVVNEFGISKKTYAHSLVEVAAHGAPAPVTVPGMSVFDLTAGRIRRLVDLENRHQRTSRRWESIVALLLAVLVLPGAAGTETSAVADRATQITPSVDPRQARVDRNQDDERPPATVRREFRFVPVDGYAADMDHDGVFESLDAVGDDLRVTRDDSSALPHEVSLLEFDLATLPENASIVSVHFEASSWLVQADGDTPVLACRAELYEGNGRIETADAARPGLAVVSIPIDRTESPGPIAFEIDPARLAESLAKSPHVGVRLGLTRGSRVILVAVENTYRKRAASLVVETLVPDTGTGASATRSSIVPPDSRGEP